MITDYQLRQRYRKYQEKYAKTPDKMYGWLGKLDGTIRVAGKKYFVYVRLWNGELIEAFNRMAPATPGYPVVVSRKGRIYWIVDLGNPYDTPLPPTLPDGVTDALTWPGSQAVPIAGQQFLPGLVAPVSGLTVRIYGGSFWDGSAWADVAAQDLDMTSYLPVSGAQWGLVEITSSGLAVTTGGAAASVDELDTADIPAPSGNPLAAIKLYVGQTAILQTAYYSDVIDRRFSGGGGGGNYSATAAVYVGKYGNDAYDGLSFAKATLTIAAAKTAAATLISGGAPRCLIYLTDGGTYTEDVALDDNMVLIGPSATLVGIITLEPGAEAHLDRHFAASGSTVLVEATNNTGSHSHYSANVLDGRGTGGALTNVDLIRNQTSGRILFARVGVGFVPQGGIGIRDATGGGGFGHIHFFFHDLYLAGNNAQAIRTNNATTNLIGYIDHILETGSPTGTVGIDMRDAGAVVKLVAGEIIADEVWNISAGDLYIVCPKATGTQTGSAAVAIIANYQPLDADLTAIAGLSPSDDDILQRKSSAWTNRTLAQYITDLTGTGTLREKLTDDRDYYVLTTGNDSHDGLSNTADGAFLTIQHAIDVATSIDVGIYHIDIHVGAGTYSTSAGNVLKLIIGAGGITIVGDETTPSNVVVTTTGTSAICFSASVASGWTLSGMQLSSTGGGSPIGIAATLSSLNYKNIEFGSGFAIHVSISAYSRVGMTGNCSILSGATFYHWSINNSQLNAQTGTLTVSGTPAFLTFLSARTGVSFFNGLTVSGSATGKRYELIQGAHIFLSSASETFLPGNAVGTRDISCVYGSLAAIVNSRVSTQFDKANTTLANITGLTANVLAGRTYKFRATLYTTSNIASGVKAAISGTATATAVIYEAFTLQGGALAVIGTGRATALGTAVGDVTAVTVATIKIEGTITVNAAGTLTVQFADNAGTNTSSVLVGSTFEVADIT